MTASAHKRYQFRDYLNKRVLTMLALGFSSGLPFALVGITFSYWLRDEHIALSAIGFLSWVTLVYSVKFLWAPFLDRLDVPLLGLLGRRRGWMALMQIIIALSLIAMAISGTRHGLGQLGICALLVAFASATQDIAIDAWRIESARSPDELGLLTSGYTFGYRAALLMSDAIILIIAAQIGWSASYILYGCLMALGLAATFLASEPLQAERVMAARAASKPLWSRRGLFDAIAGPLIAFFKAHGAKALVILLAITLFQLPNFVSGPMYAPMYVDVGLTKSAVGVIRGSFGLVGVYLGVAVGGFLPLRLGLTPALLLGGAAQIVGTMLYAIVPYAHDTATFSVIMMLDNFAIAVAGITLIAYMSSLTTLGYTATQYALLSSVYALGGKFLKGFSGQVVDAMTPHFGLMNAYAVFFIGCGLIGVPSLVLFLILERHRRRILINPA
ncbi:MAG: MFS transporter [Alphaproteobacteria bacterium]|nr:MFS transporter [Alphaproteobacteria bacterium]